MRHGALHRNSRWALFALILTVVTVSGRPTLALPTLQLGIVGGEYFETKTIMVGGEEVTLTESTFTLDKPFALQVVGATSPNKVVKIKNIELYVSILESDFLANPGGTVTVGGVPKTAANALFGTPMPPLTPHGIFPTYYFVFELGDMIFDDFDPFDENNDTTVFNTQPGGTGSDSGEIWEIDVGYTDFFYLHLDVAGIQVTLDKDGNEVEGKWTKSPFSHDADAPPVSVPEPGTLAVFVLGLAGLGLMRRRRRH
jgi:PEP-CTERM motif